MYNSEQSVCLKQICLTIKASFVAINRQTVLVLVSVVHHIADARCAFSACNMPACIPRLDVEPSCKDILLLPLLKQVVARATPHI